MNGKMLGSWCVLLLTAACQGNDANVTEPTPPAAHRPQIQKGHFLKRGQAYDPKCFGYQFAILGDDSLTIAELGVADSLLKACVADFNRLQEPELRAMEREYPGMSVAIRDQMTIDLAKYNRQLVPSDNGRGDRTVWVNCFCSPVAEHPYWRKDIVNVTDGGNCYFRVRLNLTRRSWGELEANGSA